MILSAVTAGGLHLLAPTVVWDHGSYFYLDAHDDSKSSWISARGLPLWTEQPCALTPIPFLWLPGGGP
ncbi:hypothetical protein Y1Q_0005134 [Alligator mississippiensis]|uniref:Uncharacterized protein n=1 Tax=Alligator mississippiensis TaxID=8496 RepID=A0A151NJY7_ALLMI|nr:hypothetical protein Y1Q_0005134 [Alligator mississippiensis]